MVLMWEKPKKTQTTDQWAEGAGFDGGPTGGYQPNMSEDDARCWKAKMTGKKLGFPQVEIRKQAGDSLMLLVVNLGAGYHYKSHRAAPDIEQAEKMSAYHGQSRHGKPGTATDIGHEIMAQDNTAGINIHMSMNGPSLMTFQDFADMQTAIAEAKAALESLETAPGERRLYYVVTDEKTELTTIPGVRHHYDLPTLGYRVVSAPDSALEALRAHPDVSAVKTRREGREEGYHGIGYGAYIRDCEWD